jgi:hypothetical protein
VIKRSPRGDNTPHPWDLLPEAKMEIRGTLIGASVPKLKSWLNSHRKRGYNMKRRAFRVFAASLLFAGASLILAQEPAKIVRIFREDIKSGRGAAHEKSEMGYVRAFSKSKYPNYLAMETVTGQNQAWFVERYDSYAALEGAMQLTDAEPLRSALAPLDVQDGDLRTGERTMVASYQKDLSYLPVPANLAKARYVAVSMVRVRLGHSPDFKEMRQLLNSAFEKSGSQQRRVVYSVTSGAPGGTYLILSAMDSLKAMDPNPSAVSMEDAFGPENLARYRKMQADIVTSTESTLFRVNPKMSYPPQEYITADPDFWAPKPKPAAAKPAAAKPAGGQ